MQKINAYISKQYQRDFDFNGHFAVLKYESMSVAQISEFRQKLFECGIGMRVLKKRVFSTVVQDTFHSNYSQQEGRLCALYPKDGQDCSVFEFCKQISGLVGTDFFEFVSAILDGRVVSKDALESLAKLNSKEDLYSILLTSLQGPIANFSGALNSVKDKLYWILKSLIEKKK